MSERVVFYDWWRFAEDEGGTTHIELTREWVDDVFAGATLSRTSGPDCDGATSECITEYDIGLDPTDRMSPNLVRMRTFPRAADAHDALLDDLLHELGGCVYTGQPLTGHQMKAYTYDA